LQSVNIAFPYQKNRAWLDGDDANDNIDEKVALSIQLQLTSRWQSDRVRERPTVGRTDFGCH